MSHNLLRTIKSRVTGVQLSVDENCTLRRLQADFPKFLTAAPGREETYVVHRGQLIVRCYHKVAAKRKLEVSVYLCVFATGLKRFFPLWVSRCTPVRTTKLARRLIDTILDTGEYGHEMRINKRRPSSAGGVPTDE